MLRPRLWPKTLVLRSRTFRLDRSINRGQIATVSMRGNKEFVRKPSVTVLLMAHLTSRTIATWQISLSRSAAVPCLVELSHNGRRLHPTRPQHTKMVVNQYQRILSPTWRTAENEDRVRYRCPFSRSVNSRS
jgi:hypothetical protein